MTKRFGEFIALDDVSLKVAPGDVPRAARRERRRQEHARQMHHGLLPARRAARSSVADAKAGIDNPRVAHALGLGMVYQHFTLVPAMTVPKIWCWRATTCRRWSTGARSASAWKSFSRRMPFRVPLERQGLGALRRRAAEMRNPQAALSQAPLSHSRRADLGADARRGRRSTRHAARHGRRKAISRC